MILVLGLDASCLGVWVRLAVGCLDYFGVLLVLCGMGMLVL